VFQSSAIELERLQHHHGGNEWHDMEEVSSGHDSAASDPERGWSRGRIFRCKSCEDEVLVTSQDAVPVEGAIADEYPPVSS
jgi:hypothetical protein